MTALKAHQVAKYLSQPDLDRGLTLIYGPDQGLVRETARRLMHHYAGNDDDPMSEVTIDAADRSADPSRLATEARSISMFGGLRRIRVRNGGKALVPALKDLLADMPDAIIIIEAGNLPPRDGLRALAEADKNARALPCYPDTSETLIALMRQTFNQAGITVDADLLSALADSLGNDREITRRELEKLVLFAADSKVLTSADITALCGDNASETIDTILDAAGTGRAETLDVALARALRSGVDSQRLLISALLHFTWLRRLRGQVDDGRTPREILDAQRPRPHFSRKSVLEQQLRQWRDDHLAAASARLYDAIAESRKTSALKDVIAHRALLAICVSAAHR